MWKSSQPRSRPSGNEHSTYITVQVLNTNHTHNVLVDYRNRQNGHPSLYNRTTAHSIAQIHTFACAVFTPQNCCHSLSFIQSNSVCCLTNRNIYIRKIRHSEIQAYHFHWWCGMSKTLAVDNLASGTLQQPFTVTELFSKFLTPTKHTTYLRTLYIV
jgi:hypothetical protein